MAEINLVVGVRAPIDKVFAALTTTEGLSKWWTADTQGTPDRKGGVILFRFGGHGPDMELLHATEHSRVEWTCLRHAPAAAEWVGTRISFVLTEKNGQVSVRFRHSDWRDASDFLAFCSMKWATFLLSLKEYLESGTGRPFPHDLQIS